MPAAALLLAGFAGLIHEVVWARWFALSYGGTAPAAAAVLAAYLGGLALGGAWLGRAADSARSARKLFAALQLGVAASGALLLIVPVALPAVYARVLGIGGGSSAATGAVRFALAALFLLVPATLMGGSLPAAVCWRSAGSAGDAARSAGFLRGANCLGAAAGAAAAAWLLIPHLGLSGSVLAACGANLLAAAAASLPTRAGANPARGRGSAPAPDLNNGPVRGEDSGRLAQRAGRAEGPAPDLNNDPVRGQTPGRLAQRAARVPPCTCAATHGVQGLWPWPWLVLAAFVGALALSAELAQMRAVAFYTASTIYSFAAVSAVCILALGAGSFLGGLLAARPAAPALAAMLALAGALTGLSVWVLAGLGPEAGPAVLAAAAAAPAAVFLGAAFPLVIGMMAPAAGKVGRAVGGAAAALELGSVAGPVLAVMVLLPLLGTKWTLAGLGLAAVLVAAALALGSARAGSPVPLAVRALVVLALPAAALPGLRGGLYGLDALRGSVGSDPVLEVRAEDPEAVVSVVSGFEPPAGRRLTRLFVGRKMQADDSAPWLRVEKRMGALPALLCPAPGGRALHVGLGSGVTAAWSAAAAPARAVECAELVPAVARTAARFRPHNAVGEFAVFLGDGRTRLLRERGRFELIVTDIVFPEDAGAGGLFSVEYFRLARARLADGGAFAEWLPLFQMPPESFRATLRGFLQVFPDATLWAGCLDANRPVAMLLGVRGEKVSDTFSVAGLAKRIRAARLTGAELAPLGLEAPEGVLSHFVAGAEELRALAGAGPASTDDLPLAELCARARGPQAEPWGLQNLKLLAGAWRLRLEAVPGADADSQARLAARREARRTLARAGIAAQAGDEFRGALPELRSARGLSPADPEIAFALWSLLADLGAQAVRAGQPARAREFLEEALAVGPLRDYLAHDLALACTALGETEKALALARQATALDPNEPLNWELLEKLAYNARQMEESRAAGARAAALRKLRGAEPAAP